MKPSKVDFGIIIQQREETLFRRTILKPSRIFTIICGLALALPYGSYADDPLKMIPEQQADVVLKINKPTTLIEGLLNHPLAIEAQELSLVKGILDSDDFRKFFGIIQFYENDLGMKWDEILEKIAGKGMAASLTYGEESKQSLLIAMRGTDEKVVTKLVESILTILKNEAEKDPKAEKPVSEKYKGITGWKLGKDFFLARLGAGILLSNRSEGLKAGIEQHLAGGKGSVAAGRALAEAGKILPKDELAWLWLNLKPVKEMDSFKELFKNPRDDVIQTLLFAGWLDALRRSDFLAIGLYREGLGYSLKLRLPAGKKGMAPDVALHVPKSDMVTGSLPLLQPKKVTFSHSFYLDLETGYKDRNHIVPPMVAEEIEKGEKELSRLLIGTTLPKYLAASGVHWRVVVTEPEPVEEYKKYVDKPVSSNPAFAVVATFRDRIFAKTTNALIKAGALGLGKENDLKYFEEEWGDRDVFGYRFPDKGKFSDDPTKIRFNYLPCFTTVNNHYIAASNKGLLKELVEILKKEGPAPMTSKNLQSRLYAEGLIQNLGYDLDTVIAQTIIGQALPLKEARKQATMILELGKKLGHVDAFTDWKENEFHMEIQWKK